MIRRLKQRLDGLANPILVKDLYQAAHSKAFVGTFWILLFLALLNYYVSYTFSRRGDAGQDMFLIFALLIGVMGIFVIPYMVFQGLHNEVKSRTLELVQITGIGARRLARGCMLAAATKVGLVMSVLAPFAVASFLFGGIDLAQILLTVYLLLLFSFGACAIAIFFASLTALPGLRYLARWAFMGIVLTGVVAFLVGFGELISDLKHVTDWDDLLLIFGGMGVMTVLGGMFLMAAAANGLTFPHNRTSARTKLLALIIVAAVYCWALGIVAVFGLNDTQEALLFFVGLSCPFLAVCCLMWIVAKPHVTHQQRARLARFGRLRRLLYFPFLDGPTSTFVYLLWTVALGCAACAVFFGLATWPRGWFSSSTARVSAYALGVTVTYVLYLSALSHVINRFFPRGYRTAASRRITMVILLAVSLVPLIFMKALNPWSDLAELNTVPVAFLPVTYLLTLEPADPSLIDFARHMGVPFAIGLVYHVMAAVEERRAARRGPQEAQA